jgi:hypothetical protein
VDGLTLIVTPSTNTALIADLTTLNGGSAAVSNSVIYGEGLTWQIHGATFTNTILANKLRNFQTSTITNLTFANTLLIQLASASAHMLLTDKSNFRWTGGGAWSYPANTNDHVIDASAAGSLAGNQISGITWVGPGDTGGQPDFYLPSAEHYTSGSLFLYRSGNIDDGLYGDSAGYIWNNTSYNSDGGGARSTLALAEGAPSADKIRYAANILADNNVNVACIATSGTWVKQTGFWFDYVWLSNRVASDPIIGGGMAFRPWNPTTGAQGTLCGGIPTSRGTVTVSTVMDATHLEVSSLTNISVGDWLYYGTSNNPSMRGALVTSKGVAYGACAANCVVLGKNSDGVDGIPAAVVSSTLTIVPNIWASGMYGDVGKGSVEYTTDQPRFVDTTRQTITAFDTAMGGPGTYANAVAKMVEMNGFDVTGNAVTPATSYTIANWSQWVRWGFMPQNPRAWATGCLDANFDGTCEGATHIGGVDPAPLKRMAGALSMQ